MNIELSERTVKKFCKKLASHAKVAQSLVFDSRSTGEGYEAYVHSGLIDDWIGLPDMFCCAKVSEFKLSTFLDIDKFLESKVYQLFLEEKSKWPPTTVFTMVLSINDELWVLKEFNPDGAFVINLGRGGIYMANKTTSFTLEPVDNFLEAYAKVCVI